MKARPRSGSVMCTYAAMPRSCSRDSSGFPGRPFSRLWMAARSARTVSRGTRAAGRPVYLALAMDAARRVRAKPQNLATGLPLVAREDGA